MMFLRNCWYVAGWSHDIAADRLVSRTMLGEPIVLYRKRDGSVTALEDRCCHRLAPLNQFRRLMAGLIEAEQQPPPRPVERRFG
jgi:phenylpropionate dioxygenase-like ring-hydroxylating dioxygenase large terminal subunit